MINLSLSDLLLCLITMPLTFMELVCYSWPLGNYPFLCKLAGTLEATSIYCSTLTIASIAVDRYHLIVQPGPTGSGGARTTHQKSLPFWSVVQLFCIWLVSGALACPLFIFRTLSHNPLPGETNKLLGISSVDYCFEDWPAPYWSLAYSIASTLFQFLIPVVVIVLAHASICARLSRRFRQNNPSNKTQQLLVAIAATFASCWLPLNLFNLMDSAGILPSTADKQWHHELKLTLYALCHLAGMSSACLNPVLYGWLNANIRTDLHRLFPRLITNNENKSPSNIITIAQTTAV